MANRTLDIGAVTETARLLDQRVTDRFAGRGISVLSADLVELTAETATRIEELRRPRGPLRWAIVGLATLVAMLLIVGLARVDFELPDEGTKLLDFLQAAIQDAVYLGVAVVFLSGLERRIKRRPTLAGIHELRTFAHIIDMHQLTKDPEAALYAQGADDPGMLSAKIWQKLVIIDTAAPRA